MLYSYTNSVEFTRSQTNCVAHLSLLSYTPYPKQVWTRQKIILRDDDGPIKRPHGEGLS